MIGPVLFARGATVQRAEIAALVVTRDGQPVPVLEVEGSEVTPRLVTSLFGRSVWLYDVALPASESASYYLDGRRFPVETRLGGDLAIAFVSCNGQETGDGDRDIEERDLMWRRLADEHRRRPFALLCQGGDQLYADEVLACHPEIARWAALPSAEKGAVPFTDAMRQAARLYLAGRYLTLMAQPAIAQMLAEVPSVMMWDDHDIIDGWGSLPEPVLDSPVGRGVFAVAREMFTLFQLGGEPGRAHPLCPDASGASHTLGVRFPGFAILAPDLRSERRPRRVMGKAGWAAHEALLADTPPGTRILLMSSVPALGPRLSLAEAVIDWLPSLRQYEDDLRDQWQSRAHRAEWRRFLLGLEGAMRAGSPVTLISGEIHLATRAEMDPGDGGVLHQLVASGIAHPRPSRAYAAGLGLLARLGETPLPGRPIRLKPLPGKRGIYTAERNYLVLERRGGNWTAAWELEDGGRTTTLAI